MNRRPGLRTALFFLLASCKGEAEVPKQVILLPDLEMTSSHVEFGRLVLGQAASRTFELRNDGDLPLGVESIVLQDDGFAGNFSLSWSPTGAVCPEAPAAENEASTARRATTDTWDTGGGGGSSGGGGSDGGGSDGGGGGGGGGGNGGGGNGGGNNDPQVALVLDPGCTLPVTVNFLPIATGKLFASIQVVTASESVGDEEDVSPAYYRDPVNFVQTVILEGEGFEGKGNIVVRSTSVDMGHHYPGESVQHFVYVHNVGDGDLDVSAPEVVADSCNEAFTLDTTPMSVGMLAGGDATLFGVRFTPTDLDPAFCELLVRSADPDSPEVTVSLKGNAGIDPENVPPTVSVIWPPVGYQHNAAEPLVMELSMFDKNQPATSLVCKVRSLLGETKVADCTPTDESGHVFVEIPYELLTPGTDALTVTVTDQSERFARASTTVLWDALYPASDDDGDGFGTDLDADWVDCNDLDSTVYPAAAELADGKDNDCDGAVDENTLGGDDDGDSVSESSGDCDDNDVNTYPGAMELADQKDNDCDGRVDENTSLVDDDGDGFAELDLDCDDTDVAVNPSATEYCDGVDNNCNGILDENEPGGCLAVSSAPYVIGGIQMSKTALGPGESTTLTVFVYDGDGDALNFTWTEDSNLAELGHSGWTSNTAQTVTWTAPTLPEDSPGQIFDLSVLVQDPEGQSDWAFGEVWVYPEPVETSQEVVDLSAAAAAAEDSGCGSDDSSAGLLPLMGLAGASALLRRRRRD